MKKNIWLLMLALSAVCTVFGCAEMTVTGVPEGSALTGVYEGSFNGTFNEGTLEVKLYQSPDGRKLFFGHFEEEGTFLQFRGEILENELQGQFLLPYEGTIAGKLSTDGQALSGTYKFSLRPIRQGTWQAQRQ